MLGAINANLDFLGVCNIIQDHGIRRMAYEASNSTYRRAHLCRISYTSSSSPDTPNTPYSDEASLRTL